MTTLTAQNLAALPAPTIISGLNFESIFADLIKEFLKLAPDQAEVVKLESEPITKLLQAASYRIQHERKLANDQAQGLMLATAKGAQLDHLGALPFVSTSRKVITPSDTSANPPTEAVMETDIDYRARLQLSLEGYTTAGSFGSYAYHGLAADADVKDIGIATPIFTGTTSGSTITLTVTDPVGLADPLPGDVAVTVLSRTGNGTAPVKTLEAVIDKLNSETIRPMTDRPRIRSAEIVEYTLSANVYFSSSAPDQGAILAAAKASAESYVADQHRIGRDITISGLHAAIHQNGVVKVAVTTPTDDLAINDRQAAFCTGITLTNAGFIQ